jgi:microcystin degradation protein MlrC
MGPSAVVVTDNDPELARREAQKLADMLWALRGQLKLALPDPAAAVKQAMSSTAFPVVLMDTGDNIGGGSSGDSTFLLAELLRQKAEGWVVVLADAEAAGAAGGAVENHAPVKERATTAVDRPGPAASTRIQNRWA